jgi:dephospho-CoA kinase
MIAVIGLTGQSGSGKSFLSSCFLEKGIPVIDADKVSHRVTGSDPDCMNAIRMAFGASVFDEDGLLNRKRLGRIVFSDPEKLKLLNKTVFPFITREIEAQINAAESAGQSLLLLDAPTLYEAGADRFCSFVVAVCAPFEFRLKRIVERDGLSKEAALLRLSAQHEDAYYEEKADLVLYNDGTKEEFLKKADELIEVLIRRFVPSETK